MASKHKVDNPLALTGDLYRYLLAKGVREAAPLRKLRELTAQHPRAGMASPPDEASLLQILIKFGGVKRAIEVGVFTGYSSLATALALPEDGKLIALDINEDFVSIGRPIWEEAGVAHKIDLRLGPAVDSLDNLLKDEKEVGNYDFAFIDADKPNYLNYFERLLKLVRPGGLILFDNVLWSGKVIDESVNDENTVAIRELNEKLSADERIELVMLSIADGITIARVL